jgi:hypothetical protein
MRSHEFSPDLYPQYILDMASDILFHQLPLGYGAAIALSVAQLSLSEARLVIFRMFTARYSAHNRANSGPLFTILEENLNFMTTTVIWLHSQHLISWQRLFKCGRR